MHFIIKQHFICIVSTEKESHIYFFCSNFFFPFSVYFSSFSVFVFFSIFFSFTSQTFTVLHVKEQDFINCKRTYTKGENDFFFFWFIISLHHDFSCIYFSFDIIFNRKTCKRKHLNSLKFMTIFAACFSTFHYIFIGAFQHIHSQMRKMIAMEKIRTSAYY